VEPKLWGYLLGIPHRKPEKQIKAKVFKGWCLSYSGKSCYYYGTCLLGLC